MSCKNAQVTITTQLTALEEEVGLSDLMLAEVLNEVMRGIYRQHGQTGTISGGSKIQFVMSGGLKRFPYQIEWTVEQKLTSLPARPLPRRVGDFLPAQDVTKLPPEFGGFQP